MEHGPADFRVGTFVAALPGGTCPVRERGEGDGLSGWIKRAEATVPNGGEFLCGWGGLCDELQARAEFSGVGVATEGSAVEKLEAIGVGGELRHRGKGGERFGLGDHEGAIHHEKGLLGAHGVEALGGGGVGAGKVERAKNAREVLAIDGGVDRAAIGEDIGGAAAWGEVEATGGGEEGIAHGFEVEALAIHPPEKMVIGIGALVERVVVATLLVGGGEEDEAVEIFERPAVGDEVGGEVIEEF